MPHLISDTHSGVCWLLCPPSHVLIYFVLLLSAQVDKGLSESLSLALVAAVLRVYHRAGRTEGSAVIKWNADHLSIVSHNPAAYLTFLPSAVLNSGCVDDKRNTDNNLKFHHRARRPWLQHRLSLQETFGNTKLFSAAFGRKFYGMDLIKCCKHLEQK